MGDGKRSLRDAGVYRDPSLQMPVTKTSWQKGRSGNPLGRSRSGEELATILRHTVDRKRFAEKLCELCYAGDVQAMRLLLSYTDGPPIVSAEIPDTQGIQITVTYANQNNRIELTGAYPAQAKLIQEARRFNVLCCGRRWGKTVLGMDRLIHSALKGEPVAWFSPTNKLMADAWRTVRSTLAPVTRDKSEQEKRLELVGGGVIDFWSLDSPDSGRGRKYAVVIVDEAAMISELSDAWQRSIRPTLTDLQGSAWFLSMPKGMNYFKRLFDRGQDPEREDWASWQMPTSANPYIQPGEIESARLDLIEAAFNQEYSALFVNWQGSVFRRVDEAATATEMSKPEPGHDYVIGCDWGRSKDYTVFLVLDATARAVVKMDRSNRMDYVVQVDRLKALSDYWQPIQILESKSDSCGVFAIVVQRNARIG